MSSPTVMFVLKSFLEEAETERAMTCAIAFGPGLTVETAVLERCGAAIQRAEKEGTPGVLGEAVGILDAGG